jgi:hypothetical protein
MMFPSGNILPPGPPLPPKVPDREHGSRKVNRGKAFMSARKPSMSARQASINGSLTKNLHPAGSVDNPQIRASGESYVQSTGCLAVGVRRPSNVRLHGLAPPWKLHLCGPHRSDQLSGMSVRDERPHRSSAR